MFLALALAKRYREALVSLGTRRVGTPSTHVLRGVGAAAIPITFVTAIYQIGGEIISPQGARRLLLEWPDYSMLKHRVVLALAFCVGGLALAVAGAFVIVSKSVLGANLIFSGLLVSATSLATVGLASGEHANCSGSSKLESAQLVQKLWNYCNILRDDGLSFGDYPSAWLRTGSRS